MLRRLSDNRLFSKQLFFSQQLLPSFPLAFYFFRFAVDPQWNATTKPNCGFSSSKHFICICLHAQLQHPRTDLVSIKVSVHDICTRQSFVCAHTKKNIKQRSEKLNNWTVLYVAFTARVSALAPTIVHVPPIAKKIIRWNFIFISCILLLHFELPSRTIFPRYWPNAKCQKVNDDERLRAILSSIFHLLNRL